MATVTATKNTSKYSFATRFGLIHMRGGSVTIPAALDRYEGEIGLSITESWLITKILHQKWSDDLPLVSLRKLAKVSGRSEMTLHRAKASLVAKGLLVIHQRRSNQHGKMRSAYDFTPLMDKLLRLCERDKIGTGNPIEDTDEDEPEQGTTTPPSIGAIDGGHLSEREMPSIGAIDEINVKKKDIKEPVTNVPLDHVKSVENPAEQLTALKKSPNDNGTTGERPRESPAATFIGPPSKGTANGAPPNAQEEALMLEMAESLGDRGSNGFYRLVARRMPSSLIFRALGEVKEAAREHKIKKSKGALFTAKIKKFAHEQGITLGIKSG